MSHSAITISVVMPVYNVAPYVERCLLSVMQQTRPAEECLIIDDASTDNSVALCERLMANYDGPTRFTILHHDHNRGLSAARNTGTDAATGTYIYYLDSDDEMTTDCLEKLAAPVEHDDSIEMVMGNYSRDTSAMKGWRHQLRRKHGTPQPRFMQDTPSELKSNEEIRAWFYNGKIVRPVSVWNRLLKLSFIKEHQLYNKEGRLYEDNLWMYYLMRCLNHAAFVHDVTYLHYLRPGSICTGTEYDEQLRHRGYNYREIAENIVPGERLEETMYWHKVFCLYYIDAHDNPDYQFAYNAFRREISSALHRSHLSPRPATPDLSPFQAPAIGSTSSPSHLSPCQAPAIGSASSTSHLSPCQAPVIGPASSPSHLSPGQAPAIGPAPSPSHLSPGQAPMIGSASSPSHLSPCQAPMIGSASRLGSYSTGQLRSALWLLTTVHYLSKSRVGRFLFKTALRLRRLLQRIVQTYHRARPQ